MKRAWLAAALLPVLGACAITVITRSFGPLQITEVDGSTVAITGLDYRTNIQDEDGNFVICKNWATTITYRFRYNVAPASWTSTFSGDLSGDKRSFDYSLTSGSPDVTQYNDQMVEVGATFTPTDLAPAAVRVKPASVVITPPPAASPVGGTRLSVTFVTAGGRTGTVSFPSIPVYDSCS